MATLDAAAAGALLQSVQQAAQAAAQAALALKESNKRRGNNFGFSEATKVVQCPKEFGSAVSSEDQTSWSDLHLHSNNGFSLQIRCMSPTSNTLRIIQVLW